MNNFISTTVLLFILLDPIGLALILPALLKGVPAERTRKIIFREMAIALIVLLMFFFMGNRLLAMLNLQSSTLSISGAIVLFLIALGMVFPAIAAVTSSSPHHDSGTPADDSEPFIVPIAIPLIAGPSSIAVIMLNGAKFLDTVSSLPFIASIVVAWVLSLAVLMVSPKIIKILGRRGSLALERLIGILLILIAVQMFLDGFAARNNASLPNAATTQAPAVQHAE